MDRTETQARSGVKERICWNEFGYGIQGRPCFNLPLLTASKKCVFVFIFTVCLFVCSCLDYFFIEHRYNYICSITHWGQWEIRFRFPPCRPLSSICMEINQINHKPEPKVRHQHTVSDMHVFMSSDTSVIYVSALSVRQNACVLLLTKTLNATRALRASVS